LTFEDIDFGNLVVLSGTDLTISGNEINFLSNQLMQGHQYNVTVRATNAAGTATITTILYIAGIQLELFRINRLIYVTGDDMTPRTAIATDTLTTGMNPFPPFLPGSASRIMILKLYFVRV
jgi:hypothetical protein